MGEVAIHRGPVRVQRSVHIGERDYTFVALVPYQATADDLGEALWSLAVAEDSVRGDDLAPCCFVRLGKLHRPDCPMAPPDLIERCRAEMEESLRG